MTNQHGDASKVFDALAVLSEESEWQSIIFKMKTSLAEADSVSDFVRSLNLKRGVTGYSLHVVPVALYAWLRHPDEFRTALAAALDCGGVTDTVGAILGALSGAVVGKTGIPIEWLAGIWEWPRSTFPPYIWKKLRQDLVEQNSSETAGWFRRLLLASNRIAQFRFHQRSSGSRVQTAGPAILKRLFFCPSAILCK